MAVAAPVLRDGLLGLKKDGRPSSDTMPALAACAALLEAVVALLNAQSYQTSSFTTSPASRHWACLWPCWAAGCSWLP